MTKGIPFIEREEEKERVGNPLPAGELAALANVPRSRISRAGEKKPAEYHSAGLFSWPSDVECARLTPS